MDPVTSHHRFPASHSRDASAVVAWLIDGARSAQGSDEVLTELCERLIVCGVPLWRVSVFVRTLHPEFLGRQFRWLKGEKTEVMEAPYSMEQEDNFRNSPVLYMFATKIPFRRILADPDCPMDFAILKEFHAQGATDYFGVPLFFTNGEVHGATFITRRAGGFTNAEIAAIETIAAPLARVAEVRALRRTAVNLLDAYVGHEAGERILAGRIQRGDTETIRAAIWLSDMRGFTALADSMAPPELIALLNRFFDCQVPAIVEHGGEVLKFMGDGLLAIFPIQGDADAAETCGRALVAARRARAELLTMRHPTRAGGGEALRFGLALHVGEALYGNIGGGARLDFTCIGPAVNMAARLEKLAGRLGRAIIGSSAFAQHLPHDFVALGEFELAGFRAAETVYSLANEAPMVAEC